MVRDGICGVVRARRVKFARTSKKWRQEGDVEADQ
jgi:hypothetical protein